MMDRTRRGVDDAGRLSHPAITGQPGLHRGSHISAGRSYGPPGLSRQPPQSSTCLHSRSTSRISVTATSRNAIRPSLQIRRFGGSHTGK
jgi:hypothetical protein